MNPLKTISKILLGMTIGISSLENKAISEDYLSLNPRARTSILSNSSSLNSSPKFKDESYAISLRDYLPEPRKPRKPRVSSELSNKIPVPPAEKTINTPLSPSENAFNPSENEYIHNLFSVLTLPSFPLYVLEVDATNGSFVGDISEVTFNRSRGWNEVDTRLKAETITRTISGIHSPKHVFSNNLELIASMSQVPEEFAKNLKASSMYYDIAVDFAAKFEANRLKCGTGYVAEITPQNRVRLITGSAEYERLKSIGNRFSGKPMRERPLKEVLIDSWEHILTLGRRTSKQNDGRINTLSPQAVKIIFNQAQSSQPIDPRTVFSQYNLIPYETAKELAKDYEALPPAFLEFSFRNENGLYKNVINTQTPWNSTWKKLLDLESIMTQPQRIKLEVGEPSSKMIGIESKRNQFSRWSKIAGLGVLSDSVQNAGIHIAVENTSRLNGDEYNTFILFSGSQKFNGNYVDIEQYRHNNRGLFRLGSEAGLGVLLSGGNPFGAFAALPDTLDMLLISPLEARQAPPGTMLSNNRLDIKDPDLSLAKANVHDFISTTARLNAHYAYLKSIDEKGTSCSPKTKKALGYVLFDNYDYVSEGCNSICVRTSECDFTELKQMIFGVAKTGALAGIYHLQPSKKITVEKVVKEPVPVYSGGGRTAAPGGDHYGGTGTSGGGRNSASGGDHYGGASGGGRTGGYGGNHYGAGSRGGNSGGY